VIYFLTCRDAASVKIGFSARPQARASVAQVGCPLRLDLERVCDGSKDDERALHERFSEARQRGEWFALTAEIEAHMADLPRHIWRHRGCQHLEQQA
jgi:hypothetical protein